MPFLHVPIALLSNFINELSSNMILAIIPATSITSLKQASFFIFFERWLWISARIWFILTHNLGYHNIGAYYHSKPYINVIHRF